MFEELTEKEKEFMRKEVLMNFNDLRSKIALEITGVLYKKITTGEITILDAYGILEVVKLSIDNTYSVTKNGAFPTITERDREIMERLMRIKK